MGAVWSPESWLLSEFEGVQPFFPLFRSLECYAESVNRAYISVPPCLREKIQDGNFLYALAWKGGKDCLPIFPPGCMFVCAMDYDETTWEYYSHWAGLKIGPREKGLFLGYNPERDAVPPGYSEPMDVYVFAAPDLTVVSYGNRAKAKIEKISDQINNLALKGEVCCSPEVIGLGFNTLFERPKGRGIKPSPRIKENQSIDLLKPLLEKTFQAAAVKGIKYVFKTKMQSPVKAAVLNAGHYELFLEFFKANHPGVKDCSWVKEYFLGIASKNYCHGIMVDGKLVSATDAPDMPYMRGRVQEIGINTLKEYRGRGYARGVCVSLIHALLSKNICPLWSTDENNTASDRLAKSIGFRELAGFLYL